MKNKFNPKEWNKISEEKNELTKKINNSPMNDNDKSSQVEYMLSQIESNQTDITGTYEEWVKIGFALADCFGENGRDYFHRVSQFHPEYNIEKCNYQFDKCLNANGSGVKINTFFYMCFQNDFNFKNYSHNDEQQHTYNESNTSISSNGLHISSLNEMILRSKTEPAIPYLWSGIKVGSFGFIFGPSKSGKTTFCENLALSIATNQETFFNKPILEGLRKVLFISMEEFWQPRTERNEKQLQELGVGIGDNFLTVNENFPRILNSKEDWELLKNHIIETDSEVVFIDSLSRLYSGSIEDSQLAKELLYKLRELTNELKITLIVIHHTPKQIGRPLTIDSLAGSRMLAQEADFMIGISKSLDGIRYMKEVAFRYAPENDETVTTFQINANAWLCPSYEVPEHSLLKNSDGRKDDSNKEIMLDYIEENYDVNKEFFTRTLIEQLVNTKIMAKPTMYSCLEKLTRDKKIKKVSKGKYMLCPEQA